MAGLTTQQNLESLSQISAALTHTFKKGFVDVLNEEVSLWSLLPKHKNLAEAGSMLGSAGLVVLNDTIDIPAAVQSQLIFFERESCFLYRGFQKYL